MKNEVVSEKFNKLLDTIDHLLGPDGCPWDREQTVETLRSSVLEEACEVIEAVDTEDNKNLIEELGDLLCNVIFFCKLAEKEGKFSQDAPIQCIHKKLIARHPHVFGEKKVKTAEAAVEQWENIKKSEKESILDGLPKALPALSRAYKVAGKTTEEPSAKVTFSDEEQLGQLLWEIALQAKKRKINPEVALRKKLLEVEKNIREREKNSK